MRGLGALGVLLVGCSSFVDLGGLTGGEPREDAGSDAGMDAGVDAGVDAEIDAGVDAGVDAGHDAGVDAGPPCPVVMDMEMAFIEIAQGSYCIDKTEVTNEMYLAFHDNRPTDPEELFVSKGCKNGGDVTPLVPWPPNPGREPFPVGGVSYCGAEAYCKYVGKSLCGDIGTGGNLVDLFTNNPTHDSWMRACGGSERFRFPYGDTFDMAACNGLGTHSEQAIPVGEEPGCASEDGVLDLSGNVWEWVLSCDTDENQTDICAYRGGAANSGEPELACDGNPGRQQKAARVDNIGFRCCLHNP
jgi:sulfatase modifying factor 1